MYIQSEHLLSSAEPGPDTVYYAMSKQPNSVPACSMSRLSNDDTNSLITPMQVRAQAGAKRTIIRWHHRYTSLIPASKSLP